MIEIPFAHAGHWFVSLLYILPLVVIAVVATVVTIKERRAGPDPEEPDPDVDDESELGRRNS
jgi:hypothetical protein